MRGKGYGAIGWWIRVETAIEGKKKKGPGSGKVGIQGVKETWKRATESGF